jgi:hypothetical protein
MADPKTMRNLQAYIYKRPQDQTHAQIYAHIEKVHSQLRLTPANWDTLLVPACTHPDAALLRWLVDHGARPHKQLTKLMTMTVGSQERRLAWIDRRIEVLEALVQFVPEGDTEPLSQALSSACWFNNIGPAAWLIENGADINYTSWNAFRRAKVDCLTNAEMYGDRFGDYTLHSYLKPWHESRTPLGDWRQFYEHALSHADGIDEA